jgi:hypothetical protein
MPAPPVIEPGLPDYPCPPFCEEVVVTGTNQVPLALYPTAPPPYPGTPPGRGSPRGGRPPGPYLGGQNQVGLAPLLASLPLPAIAGYAEPGVAQAALQTGEEVLAQLLDQTFRPNPTLQTELEQLIERGPQTELERLLQKPLSTTEIEFPAMEAAAEGTAARGLLGLLGALGNTIALALYAEPAGLPAGEEALRVIAGLEPPGGGNATGVTTTVPSDQGLPEPVGVLPFFPAISTDVLIKGHPASAPAPVPFEFAATVPQLGTIAIPSPTTAVRPKPQPQPKVAPTPARQPVGTLETGLITQPLFDFSLGHSPKPRPLPLGQPQKEPQQKCDCTKQKDKKDKKKKKPRTVCYRGTYTEGPTTLHKRRKEKIPCQ